MNYQNLLCFHSTYTVYSRTVIKIRFKFCILRNSLYVIVTLFIFEKLCFGDMLRDKVMSKIRFNLNPNSNFRIHPASREKKIPSDKYFKNNLKGCGDDLAVKNTVCSSRGPGVMSSTHLMAHSHL